MNDILVPDALIVPAEIIESLMAEQTDSYIPAKYWPGVAYTAPIGEAPDSSLYQADRDSSVDQNSHQDTGEAELLKDYQADKTSNGYKAAKKYQWAGKKAILTPEELALLAKAESVSLSKAERTRLYQLQAGQSAKHRALEAQRKRVSRKLLLTERAKRITIACPDTGVVAQMDIPAINGYALIWSCPLSSLDNCRGMAQKGQEYLESLDTQILAGILITLAGSYDLFRYQPFDSGAQKNAIIRTAGKNNLISAILMIENLIHSNNASLLPKLSMIMDVATASVGIELKMKNYLQMLADAIAKPDREEYDENALSPYRIRPVLAKKEKHLSVNEIAQKEYEADKKQGKIILKALAKEQPSINQKLVQFISGLLTDNALLMMPSAMIFQIVEKLESRYPDSELQKKLVAILNKDRFSLKGGAVLKDIGEDEEENEQEVEEQEKEDDSTSESDSELDDSDTTDSGSDLPVSDDTKSIASDAEDNPSDAGPSEPELVPPEGLSSIQKILWKKKMQAAAGTGTKAKVYVTSNLPSVAVYVPSTAKEKLGKE